MGSIVAVAALVGCAALRGPAPSTELAVEYGVFAERPPTYFLLRLPAAGDGEVFVGHAIDRETTDTLGTFRVALPPSTRRAIAEFAWRNGLLGHASGENATAEGAGRLVLAGWGRRADVSMVDGDETVFAFRRLLDGAIRGALASPLRALRLSMAAKRDGARVNARLTVASVGTEPVRVVLADKDLGRCTGASVTAGGASSVLACEGVRALAARGVVPAGEAELAPGASFTLDLPSLDAPPGAEIVGRVSVWFSEVKGVHTLGAALASP